MGGREIYFRCPSCGARMKSSADMVDEVVQCLDCGRDMRVPPPSDPKSTADDYGGAGANSSGHEGEGQLLSSPWFIGVAVSASFVLIILMGLVVISGFSPGGKQKVEERMDQASAAVEKGDLEAAHDHISDAASVLEDSERESDGLRSDLNNLRVRLAEKCFAEGEEYLETEEVSGCRALLDMAQDNLQMAGEDDSQLAKKVNSYVANLDEGKVRYKGEWVTQEEREKKKKGLVKHEGEWVTPEEKKKMEDGLVKYKGEWVTSEEKANREKGLVEFNGEWITPEQRRKRQRAMAIPIIGTITPESVKMVQTGVDRALEKDRGTVIMVIDTGGGQIEAAKKIGDQIDRLRAEDTYVAAYVTTKQVSQGAISAGAYVTFACDDVFMVPGSTIGAAQLVQLQGDGIEPVRDLPAGAKRESIWVANFQAVVSKNGYPDAIANAMAKVDDVVWVKEDSKSTARFEVSESRPGGNEWEKLVDDDDLCTLTADKMKQYGLATVVGGKDELKTKLGVSNSPFHSGAFFAQSVDSMEDRIRAQEKAVRRAKKLLGELDKEWQKLQIKGNMDQPATSAREARDELREKEEVVRELDKISEELMRIAELYPELFPPGIRQQIERSNQFCETALEEVIPEGKRQIREAEKQQEKDEELEEAKEKERRLLGKHERMIRRANVARQEVNQAFARRDREDAKKWIGRWRDSLKNAGKALRNLQRLADKYPELGLSQARLETWEQTLKDKWRELKEDKKKL